MIVMMAPKGARTERPRVISNEVEEYCEITADSTMGLQILY